MIVANITAEAKENKMDEEQNDNASGVTVKLGTDAPKNEQVSEQNLTLWFSFFLFEKFLWIAFEEKHIYLLWGEAHLCLLKMNVWF